MFDFKRFVAIFTMKRLLSRMNLDMVLQRVLLFEFALTLRTLEGTLSGMDSFVLFQIGFPRKLLSTIFALQRIGSVHNRVNLEIALMLKLFGAQFTFILLIR